MKLTKKKIDVCCVVILSHYNVGRTHTQFVSFIINNLKFQQKNNSYICIFNYNYNIIITYTSKN